MTTELNWPSHDIVNSHDDPFLFEIVEFLVKVRAVEPDVTASIQAAIPEGAAPHGLRYRLKHWQSLKRKAEGVIAMNPYAFDGLASIAEIARAALRKIDDILRYSVLSTSHDDVSVHASLFLEQVHSDGMSVVSILNSYHEGSRYKGLHAILSLQHRFDLDIDCEVQFHSPESIDAYVCTHEIYEELRTTEGLEERQAFHDIIAARYQLVDDIMVDGNIFPIPITNRTLRRPLE
ncbi:hypothetical protein [Pseudarthrobacter sp. J47]|uniref:hypothetical protein n=1 Tax=Pseudarthrobacter sp. J47 TaxID=3116482 RepID=UPI002E805AFF|nr:hypothetical protein [Pseudarthrobacter sp. J47]MEE2523306.1 hypothetical protein [Pseudarthrobacter sp. J47]